MLQERLFGSFRLVDQVTGVYDEMRQDHRQQKRDFPLFSYGFRCESVVFVY